jgi:cytochrome oxidase Cu insertion factor (SCO1/SenC/PrrC family)
MASPIHRYYIEQQLMKFSQQSEAYNFSLPDVNGNYISLKDLKGKAVLIDFWFTGCTACISFHKVLEKNIVPFYKDADVVFVTIGLDTEKEKWLKSVKTGFYTNDYSINLFTEGLGFAHPLATYYNIQGCPTLLLIDPKGNISSANPAWDPVKLCEEINALLKKSRPE